MLTIPLRRVRPSQLLSSRRVFINHKHTGSTENVLGDLTRRGFVQDVTRPQVLHAALNSRQQAVYAGIDPTAKSLHIGHLIPLMCLLHFQLRGYQVIPLIGGATGLVGDPSGRVTERQPADVKQVEDNVASLTEGVNLFFSRGLDYAKTRNTVVVDDAELREPCVKTNLEWHRDFSMLQFLQKVGVHARVNTMLNRESVRTRLDSQSGISFTEFTYQLLQAYDFYHLHKHHNCNIQVGGSDQWGNILAGLDLITKLDGGAKDSKEAFGITTPLLTTATGEKFGKSAGNAVWLDPNITSVFDFYQYFLKTTDADVEKMLHLFTLLTHLQVEEVMQMQKANPETRIAQRRLAAEVTQLVHTESGRIRAETLTNLLFEQDLAKLQANEIISALQGDPRLVSLAAESILQVPISKLAAKHNLVASNSAARALISSRGLYINNAVVTDAQQTITPRDLLDGRLAVIRAGKDKLLILTLQSS